MSELYLPSQLAEEFLFLEGQRFSLSNGYDLYRPIYDTNAPVIVLLNARQTGKTLTVANKIALESVTTPFCKSFYISPSQQQTTRFSHTKLQKIINGSPVIKHWFSKGEVNNVFLKVAGNGSEVTLSYASDDPDRTRGVTSDRNYYDEGQDMDLPEIMIVADSCMDASLDPRKIISGTPKTYENPLEDMWQRSCQYEALIRCRACNKWNLPSLKNIGKYGFICAKCGKLLNVREFQWKAFKPENKRVAGFHIPQIIIPAHTENPNKWNILLDKYDSYPINKFKNEVMAMSDSQGSRLLSRRDLEACCYEYEMSREPTPELLSGMETIVAGVDWSGGGKDGISRTVIHVWGIDPNFKFKTLFYKVYNQEDPTASVEDIILICNKYKVQLVIGDQGEGALANGMLTNALGRMRVGKFRYGSFANPLTLADNGVYQLDKTTIIDNYFKFIKDGGIILPNSVQANTAIEDILAEFSEVTAVGKKVWKHSMSRPDDCLHAQIGGWIAGKLLKRQLTFY